MSKLLNVIGWTAFGIASVHILADIYKDKLRRDNMTVDFSPWCPFKNMKKKLRPSKKSIPDNTNAEGAVKKQATVAGSSDVEELIPNKEKSDFNTNPLQASNAEVVKPNLGIINLERADDISVKIDSKLQTRDSIEHHGDTDIVINTSENSSDTVDKTEISEGEEKTIPIAGEINDMIFEKKSEVEKAVSKNIICKTTFNPNENSSGDYVTTKKQCEEPLSVTTETNDINTQVSNVFQNPVAKLTNITTDEDALYVKDINKERIESVTDAILSEEVSKKQRDELVEEIGIKRDTSAQELPSDTYLTTETIKNMTYAEKVNSKPLQPLGIIYIDLDHAKPNFKENLESSDPSFTSNGITNFKPMKVVGEETELSEENATRDDTNASTTQS